MTRQQIVDLIRNQYDPAPAHYKLGDSWDDGAERIADAILGAAQTEQKPAAWGRMIDGEAITVSRFRTGANDEPLYASLREKNEELEVKRLNRLLARAEMREIALERAAIDFVAKVERGEVRSKRSYAAFKMALAIASTQCQCAACKRDGPHMSYCAVHNAPAMSVGVCTCDLVNS